MFLLRTAIRGMALSAEFRKSARTPAYGDRAFAFAHPAGESPTRCDQDGSRATTERSIRSEFSLFLIVLCHCSFIVSHCFFPLFPIVLAPAAFLLAPQGLAL
jgi:hypothetical protein